MKFLKLLKKHIWTILLIIFLAASFINKYGDKIVDWYKIQPYLAKVDDCYQEAIAKTEKKVIGLDYSCAIDVAATIYEEDPDLAVAICSRYSFLPENEPLSASICRQQIEGELNETGSNKDSSNTGTKTEITEVSETQVNEITANTTSQLQNTFENTKYGYSFSYPENYKLSNWDDYNDDIKTSKSIALWDENEKYFFIVDVLDPEPLKEYPDFQDAVERYQLPLKDYVDYIYAQNNPKEVFGLVSYTVGGGKGYQMWITNSFCDGNSCRTVEIDSAYFYVKNNQGLIIKISIPLGGGEPENILASFKIL
ncbi:MAG: hypothetical protein AAB592_00180 [Patescibacteria group bacterium]